MKLIKREVKRIREELCGARSYAEKYIEYKALDDKTKAERYKEMAKDELKHASWLHEALVTKIDKLKTVMTVPDTMIKKWQKAHSCYVSDKLEITKLLEM